MSEDTPVNTGVVCRPDSDSAWWAVRKTQLTLHRWASQDKDKARRFDHHGVVFQGASSVAVTRYRYRSTRIPTLWTITEPVTR
jgi:hypothetical protein